MWTHAFSVLATGVVLTAAGFFAGPAQAQSDSAKPAVLEVFRERFILAQLYTDGGADGDKNQRLQVERFRTLAMPYYVILAPNNAVLATHAGVLPSVAGFLEFLDQGSRMPRAQNTTQDSPTPRRS